jgi:hypothetical protein
MPGTTITVQFRDQTKTTTPWTVEGQWRLRLDPMNAGPGPTP